MGSFHMLIKDFFLVMSKFQWLGKGFGLKTHELGYGEDPLLVKVL